MKNFRDRELTKILNLPAAAASVTTEAIDLGTGPHQESLEIRLAIDATPSLADTKTQTVSLEHSDDNENFVALTGAASLVATGAGGVGAAAAESRQRVPYGTKRYIRGKAEAVAVAGDSTAETFTFELIA